MVEWTALDVPGDAMAADPLPPLSARLLRGEKPADTPWSAPRWKEIRQELSWHRVGLRVAPLVLACLPESARGGWMASNQKILQRSAANLDTLARVTRAFETQQIRYLSLKGPALGQLIHGNACIKQSADLDILIPAGDVPRAITLLQSLGLQPWQPFPARPDTWSTIRRLCKDWSFTDPGNNVHIELHWRVENNPYLLATDFEGWYQSRQRVDLGGFTVDVMGLEHTFVHVLVHGARSLWTRLHWLADLDALLRRQDLDWSRLARELPVAGLTQTLLFSLELAEEFLASPTPAAFQPLRAGITPGQRRRVERLKQYTRVAMAERKHHTYLALRHSHLLLKEDWRFWLYEGLTLIGPHHPDVLQLPLPIQALPVYVLLRPWLVCSRLWLRRHRP